MTASVRWAKSSLADRPLRAPPCAREPHRIRAGLRPVRYPPPGAARPHVHLLHRPGAAPEVREANDQAFTATTGLITQACAQGDIVGDDPGQVATAVLATVQGLAAIAGGGMLTGPKPVDAVVCDTITILISGLRPREPRHQAQPHPGTPAS